MEESDQDTEAAEGKDLLDIIPPSSDNDPREYVVSLQSRQLGMTIENVLERTIVRSVYQNSEAFRLNVRTNSLILNIGGSSTKDQTHLETLEALKNTVRPVRLRMYELDEKTLTRYRAEMQQLVQRQKFNSQETSSILTTVERKLLWIFELYSFLECISAAKLLAKARTLLEVDLPDETNKQKALRNEEAEFCQFNADDCITRALKLLDAFELTRQTFIENERREALVHMRCGAISESMFDIRELFAWTRSSGFVRSNPLSKKEFEYLSNVIGVPPVDLFSETIRNLCYTVFLITNDQQPDLQQSYPDRATCDVLDIVISNTLTKKMLREQHIPSLWKLAGSSSVQARIACANLIPLVYIHLSSLQRLRIRGLVNRLMVDSISSVRAYVLSSVCVRILRSIVTPQPTALGAIEGESITLNWIAHCMIQGSVDNEMEVRKSALQTCRMLIEYSALGANGSNPGQNEIVKELDSYVADIVPKVLTFPFDDNVTIPSLSDVHIMFCRALPIISRLVEDREPEIRSYVGTYCGEFCLLMGAKWSAILLDVIFTCCRDPVMEVRVAGLSGVPHAVLAFIQDAYVAAKDRPKDPNLFRPLTSLIMAICSMSKDLSIEVKQILCQILSKVLTLFYSIQTNSCFASNETFIVSLEISIANTIIQLLNDIDPEVSTEMISQFEQVLEKEYVSGESSYASIIFTKENSKYLISSIENLSKQTNWRIRKLICSIIPKIVSTLSTIESQLLVSNIILSLVNDSVFDVRKSASRSLCLSAMSLNTEHLTDSLTLPSLSLKNMGRNWLDSIVLPQLETLRTSRIYSNRILSLHMIVTLLIEDVIPEGDVRYDILIKVALALSSDSVPNVRIALCEMLSVIGPLIQHHTLSPVSLPLSPSSPSLSPSSPSPSSPSSPSLSQRLEENHSTVLLAMIVNTLTTLESDSDRDVKYYAMKAISSLDEREGEREGHQATQSPFLSSLFRRKTEENKSIVTELDERTG